MLWVQRAILTLTILCCTTTLFSADKSINFIKGKVKDAQRLAGVQNQLVFVYVYENDCPACLYMEEYVFTQKEVYRTLNKQFVSVKIAEADFLDQTQYRYPVPDFPAFIILDPNGNALHKAIGGMDAADFLSVIRTSLDSTKRLSTLQARYQNNLLNKAELYDYIYALAAAMEPLSPAIEDYIRILSKEEITATHNWELLREGCAMIDSPCFQTLFAERTAIIDTLGYEEWDDYLIEIIYVNAEAAIEMRDSNLLAKSLNLLSYHLEVDSIAKAFIESLLWMEYYKSNENWVAFGNKACFLVDNLSYTNNYDIHQAALLMYYHVDDSLLLSRAQAWIHKINSTEPPTYELLSAEAALSYKIGQLQLAFNLIQDAKKLAWEQEMDTEFIDELEILVKESASSKGIKLKNPKSK